MTETVERLLVDGNIAWTAEEIRERLSKAGYAIVLKQPRDHWRVPDWTAMTPRQYYTALVEMAERETE